MRRIAFVLVVLGIVAPSYAPADVTVVGEVRQHLYMNGQQTDGSGHVYYDFTAMSRVKADGAIDARASASIVTCDVEWACESRTYPWQLVSPTALRFDALGNAGSFVAELNPDANTTGGPQPFDLELTRPRYTVQCLACVGTPNAWVDPSTNSVGANVAAYPGLSRGNYDVTGTFAGGPMPQLTEYQDNWYWTSSGSNVSATAP